jgi:integrase
MGKLTLREFRTVHGENMLAQIAEHSQLGRSSLKHCKAFLSGCFKQAKRLGILDGINPMMDTSIPRAPEPEDTYAYDLDEIKAMLGVLTEPAYTVVLTAALTGLRKGEIRGLQWVDFNGEELSVKRSVWNSTVNPTKTKKSTAPIPVVKQLAEAFEKHKARTGEKLAQPNVPIFQGSTGQPLNLDNLVRREIIPALSRCAICGKPEEEHKPEGHEYKHGPVDWHGWHAFRRGLATNLHVLRIDDKTIQAILRHTDIRLTQNTYIKSVEESEVNAMDVLAEKFQIAPSRIQ